VNFVEIIARKRDGIELTREEVACFVRGATDGSIPDEQLAALLMAICLRGASGAETQALVEEMRDSGARWRLADDFPGCIDKHSTGGVGDTVSLVFAPLVASCGVPVSMMAGAGLGHTQGTLDKLLAIPGFTPVTSRGEALARLGQAGACFAAQSREIAPADGKLYALRDLTATVPSLALIVASIMSKKLAVGASALVLDVKWGSGAFRKTEAAARELAESLVGVAHAAGVPVRALVTDMNEPLGRSLGCAGEVREALAVLEGRGARRLGDLTVELATEALVQAGRGRDVARAEAKRALADGSARRQYDSIVQAHGGDPDPKKLARPTRSVVATAARSGWVTRIDAEVLGWVAVALGAGRRRRGDAIDVAAGLRTHAGIGEAVEAGAPLVTLDVGDRVVDGNALAVRAAGAFTLDDEPAAERALVVERLG
jgi:pyrimidine-nucleoside phosphorylase